MSKNYNIISFEFEPSSKRGGQELALFEVLSGLKENGFDITLGYVKEGDLVHKYNSIGIKTIQIPRINITKTFSLKQWIELYRSSTRIKKSNNTIVYINQIFDSPLALLYKIKFGYKIICHLRLPALGMGKQIRFASHYVDKYIVANIKMEQSHIINSAIPPEKITIIPDGVDLTTTNILSQKNKTVFKIAYIGRITESKGLTFLIQGIKALTSKTKNFHLDIAGQPTNQDEFKYLEYLKENIKKEKLTDYISFIGHVANPISHLSNYNLSIFPSQGEESFGRVLVESLVANTPIIASDIGSVSEIIDDKNKEWIFCGVDNMVELILKVMNYPESYPIAQKKAFVKSNYDIQKVNTQINILFKSYIN